MKIRIFLNRLYWKCKIAWRALRTTHRLMKRYDGGVVDGARIEVTIQGSGGVCLPLDERGHPVKDGP